MKLVDLIKTNNWLSVKYTLLSLYPDQQVCIDAYEKIFSVLQKMDAQYCGMRIVLRDFDGDLYNKAFTDVSGQNEQDGDEDNATNYAIEFTSWPEWLGMNISENSLKEYNELEIISHCLYEMTFVGYNEEEIQSYLSSVEGRLDEFKSRQKSKDKKSKKGKSSQ